MNGICTAVTTNQEWWRFPVHQIPEIVAIGLYNITKGYIGSCDFLCRAIVSFLVSLLYSSLILAVAAHRIHTKTVGM